MEIKRHFGVYAVCFENGKLLCIEKTRDHYQHRYDLPGGSQRLGEGLTESLKREVLEDTRLLESTMFSSGKSLKNFTVHHVMALYDVDINEEAP